MQYRTGETRVETMAAVTALKAVGNRTLGRNKMCSRTRRAIAGWRKPDRRESRKIDRRDQNDCAADTGARRVRETRANRERFGGDKIRGRVFSLTESVFRIPNARRKKKYC